jgi:Mg2+ and Co2+ transporter CorA
MDYQILFNASAAIAFTLAGWIIRSVYDAVEKLKVDMLDLERQMHSKYVQKDDYREDVKEIKDMLAAIFKRLEQKQDK